MSPSALVPLPVSATQYVPQRRSLAVVRIDAPDERTHAFAAEQLAAAGVSVRDDAAEVVRLRLADGAGPVGASSPERYTLCMTRGGVLAEAVDPVGLARAVTTLRQLVDEDVCVPSYLLVRDAPRFEWRALSMDIVRHWFGMDVLREVVDLAASLKMNVLHLHLTDSQGWRLEIPSYPELTRVSGQTQIGGGPAGYLSAQDYRDLQNYAAARFVTIVPEIDLPGHMNAALHARAELNPDGRPAPAFEVIDGPNGRLWWHVPDTVPFLRTVLAEVAQMTDGPYVHVGGDEVEQMSVEEYVRFIALCEQVVREHGKTPVMWQEGAHGPVRPGTLVQFWDRRLDYDSLSRAAKGGARFIMSPAHHVYLDMKYTPACPTGSWWAAHVDLRDSYEWDPEQQMPQVPDADVAGVEGCVWTELIETRERLFQMLLPRAAAIAEVGWSGQQARSWESFRRRVAELAPTWSAAGWPFHPTAQVEWQQDDQKGA